uniref:Uncharacterized protein n=1 Tax=Bactrocera dorsalis TaxID=27457 RepID=A0A034WX31_BACDO
MPLCMLYIRMRDFIDKNCKPLFVWQYKCTLGLDGKRRPSNKPQQQKQQSTILETRIRAASKQWTTQRASIIVAASNLETQFLHPRWHKAQKCSVTLANGVLGSH